MSRSPVVELYTRSGCHLCGPAADVVARVCATVGLTWIERDVDADPRTVRRFGELVPVVCVDGVTIDHWRIGEERLRAAVVRAMRQA